jgi:hypothetical protein
MTQFGRLAPDDDRREPPPQEPVAILGSVPSNAQPLTKQCPQDTYGEPSGAR